MVRGGALGFRLRRRMEGTLRTGLFSCIKKRSERTTEVVLSLRKKLNRGSKVET